MDRADSVHLKPIRITYGGPRGDVPSTYVCPCGGPASRLRPAGYDMASFAGAPKQVAKAGPQIESPDEHDHNLCRPDRFGLGP